VDTLPAAGAAGGDAVEAFDADVVVVVGSDSAPTHRRTIRVSASGVAMAA
jgi:hypothetical protein